MSRSIFAPTINLITKRCFNARNVSTRRAFFMSNRQVIDSTDKNLSAACLRWYLSYPHFNFSLCDELIVGGEEGSRFFCSQLTINSIMSKTTNPQTELVTVQITPQQAEILEIFINPREAHDFADRLMDVCISALCSQSFDAEKVALSLMFTQRVYKMVPSV